ncbi:MAG TPA: hypothetical protein V6C97_35170 [Oculatellaceae cyanobacterium]
MDEAVLLPECVEETSVHDETEDDSSPSQDASSMSFNLQTSGLAVQIKTKLAANLTVVELQSKLEFALLMLSQTEARLEAAQKRIGFLEAHLEAQTQLDHQAQSQQGRHVQILLPKR